MKKILALALAAVMLLGLASFAAAEETAEAVAEVAEGIACFERIGELLGKDSFFYLGAIEGVDRKMNIELEKYLSDPFSREAMIAEAAVQLMMNGAYVDVTDIRRSFTFDHWVKKVTEFAAQYGIR